MDVKRISLHDQDQDCNILKLNKKKIGEINTYSDFSKFSAVKDEKYFLKFMNCVIWRSSITQLIRLKKAPFISYKSLFTRLEKLG